MNLEEIKDNNMEYYKMFSKESDLKKIYVKNFTRYGS